MNYSIVHLHIPQPEFADIFLTEMLDLGFDSFEETPNGLAAYIDTDLLDTEALNQLIEQYASLTDVRLVSIEPLANKNWNELWESNFQPEFYIHLGLLHISLFLRVIADYANFFSLRMRGGLLNEFAMLIFIGVTISSVRKSIRYLYQ